MNALILAVALSLSSSIPTQVVKETVITVKAPAKKWSCGAPRSLENDAVQTVRLCQTK